MFLDANNHPLSSREKKVAYTLTEQVTKRKQYNILTLQYGKYILFFSPSTP